MKINKSPANSFKYAVDGIIYTFRTQLHMRIHFFFVLGVLFLGLITNLSKSDMVILLFTVSLVLVAEMINTAIESVVDLVTDTYHPLAKSAKDIAAGAVLVTAVNAIVVGVLLFFTDKGLDHIKFMYKRPPVDPVISVTIGIVFLMLIVLIGKVFGQKGTILQGGVISGHSAVAMFLALCITLYSNNLMASILALCLCALVMQSRVEGKIHTVQEVLIGALAAAIVMGIVFFIRQ